MAEVPIHGRRLDRLPRDLEQDLHTLVTDEYYSDNPDKYLMGLLVEAVVLCREYADMSVKMSVMTLERLDQLLVYYGGPNPGDNFRERERIKRKMLRWVKRLNALPPPERQYLQRALSPESAQVQESVKVNRNV